MGSGRMVMGIFRVPLTDACHFPATDVSRYRPELRVDILSSLSVGETESLIDVRVRGHFIPEDIASLVAPGAWVRSSTVVYASPLMAVVRVHQPRSPLSTILDAADLPIRYPLRLDMGTLEIAMIGGQSTLEDLLAQFRDLSLASELRSQGAYSPRRFLDTLSPSELRVLRAAVSSGYWENPRRTTVEELSHILQLSTNSLSESLSAIEQRVSRSSLLRSELEDARLPSSHPA